MLKIINGDCRTELNQLPAKSVQCCVTSPPYWGLRDYGHPDQIGQEESPQRHDWRGFAGAWTESYAGGVESRIHSID